MRLLLFPIVFEIISKKPFARIRSDMRYQLAYKIMISANAHKRDN